MVYDRLYIHAGNPEESCEKNLKVLHCMSKMICQQCLLVFFMAAFVHKQDIVFYKSVRHSYTHVLH